MMILCVCFEDLENSKRNDSENFCLERKLKEIRKSMVKHFGCKPKETALIASLPHEEFKPEYFELPQLIQSIFELVTFLLFGCQLKYFYEVFLTHLLKIQQR